MRKHVSASSLAPLERNIEERKTINIYFYFLLRSPSTWRCAYYLNPFNFLRNRRFILAMINKKLTRCSNIKQNQYIFNCKWHL